MTVKQMVCFPVYHCWCIYHLAWMIFIKYDIKSTNLNNTGYVGCFWSNNIEILKGNNIENIIASEKQLQRYKSMFRGCISTFRFLWVAMSSFWTPETRPVVTAARSCKLSLVWDKSNKVEGNISAPKSDAHIILCRFRRHEVIIISF